MLDGPNFEWILDHYRQPAPSEALVDGSLVRRVPRHEIDRIGAKAGSSYAVHQARRTFASAPRRAALDSAHQLRTAEQVAEALGNMKGALMKVGQMLSYLDDGLPEPLRDALAQLQQDAPPMSAEPTPKVARVRPTVRLSQP